MYKVFFNDSTIEIGSGDKKSFKNNIKSIDESFAQEIVDQFVGDGVEKSSNSHVVIHSQHLEQFWTHFKNQFVEIPAAGGFVKNEDGAFLFIRRLGVWDLPKGKIELNETSECAALREVEEECGLTDLRLVRQLDSTYHIYRSPYLPYPKNLVLKESRWFLMNYSGMENPVPQTEEDIEEVRWFAATELDQVLADTYSSLHEFLGKTLSAI